MPRIKLKRKRRKIVKLRGKRYAGYGQVSGGHRGSGQRGGFGRAGIKDHMKIKYLKEGFEYGSRGFTRHAQIRPEYPINIGKLVELAMNQRIKCHKEDGKLIIDLSTLPFTKILGAGRVDVPVKLILPSNVSITKKAEEKIKDAGGEIVTVEK